MLLSTANDRLRTVLFAAVGAVWAGVALPPALPIVAGLIRTDPGGVFGLGALVGVLGGALLGRVAPMLPVLEHELTHLVAALALFRTPRAIEASEQGGAAVYSGRGSVLIRLAPYVLPTSTLAVLPLTLWIRTPWMPGVLGLTWGYQLWRAASDTRPHQPDLRAGGLVVSGVAVLAWGATLFTTAAVASIGGRDALAGWARAVQQSLP